MLETYLNDVNHALRAQRRSPVPTVVAVLVTALGSGAVTTTSSATNAMLLRPLQGVADRALTLRAE